jgi:SAM-dependent methyltransferase
MTVPREPPHALSPSHFRRDTCRSCGGRDLRLVVDLGSTALANSFPRSPDEFLGELRVPLELYWCAGCSLVQLLHVVPAEQLFSNYIYVTGTSDTIALHNQRYAASVVQLLNLRASDLVVEVASNDGSLLACFQRHGVRVTGIEPAGNIAEAAVARGVPTLNRFFGEAEGRRLRGELGPASVVCGNNVLAHVDDTLGFLRGARALLAEQGRAIFEVPYLGEFLENVEYDTVYHEHLCYFSITALLRLFEEAGLRLVRVERHPVHGGTVRVFGAPDSQVREHGAEVLELAARERAAGWSSFGCYERFARGVGDSKRAVLELFARLADERKTVAGYGAPAKGNTLLQYCGLTPALLPYTVDKNPLKVGRFTPGTHLPVLDVEALLERQPDVVFILAWNFADEIVRQQAEYARRGGRFVTPLPLPRFRDAGIRA